MNLTNIVFIVSVIKRIWLPDTSIFDAVLFIFKDLAQFFFPEEISSFGFNATLLFQALFVIQALRFSQTKGAKPMFSHKPEFCHSSSFFLCPLPPGWLFSLPFLYQHQEIVSVTKHAACTCVYLYVFTVYFKSCHVFV